MVSRLRQIRRLPNKVLSNLKLLRRDPELFARNLLQFTNPPLFERRLMDVRHAAPMHVRFEADEDGPPRLNVLDSAWTT